MRILIDNGRIIDPANDLNIIAPVYIADGVVVAIGSAPDGFQVDKLIDATNRIVCPGLVDLRARLREPGLEHKATIASETAAAASGGITTLVCPPDTDPVIDNPAIVELIHHKSQACGKAKVLSIGALTKNLESVHLSEMSALKQAGCVGVGNALKPISNGLVMRRAMEYAATLDLTLFLHAEDEWLHNAGCCNEGFVSTHLGLAGIPECAETVAVARELILIERIGVRAHFCQLSTSKAVMMINRARHDGLQVTMDVTAAHLHLTELDIGNFDPMCHVRPPFRTEADRLGLINGLKSGSIDAVCSDHQPHDIDAKLAPFNDTEPGISGLETLLPLSLQIGELHTIEISKIIDSLTCRPAKILRIDAGTLGVGKSADVCVFDPSLKWKLSERNMISQGHNSPFLDKELKGKVTHTLLNGNLVYETVPV